MYLNWIRVISVRFVSILTSHERKTWFDRACARWLVGCLVIYSYFVCVRAIAWSWNAVRTLSYDKTTNVCI